MSDSLRIDRWLFFCRMYKSRSQATDAVTGGHVKLNGERTSPGARVKVGDTIDLVRHRLPYSLEVVAIPARRGPAKEAQACYEENEMTRLEREKLAEQLKFDRLLMPRTSGRPDKHTRRRLRRISRHDT
ncbi:MAG: RNA-binding S4 domain-containing protein [Woeseiaceae bacterium]|nr:RNA-binding S4 domain-containing protein [Woeseiaceae bacterium]